MMSRKIEGFASSEARLKHHNLLQDYKELQEEVNAMRSRLDAANTRKLVLAAEVRFLRRRRRCLIETNTAHVNASTSLRRAKSAKKKPIATKETANKRKLPSSVLANSNKKQRKAKGQSFTIPTSDSNNIGSRINALDLNLRNPSVPFDLNMGSAQPSSSSSLKAPIFDLNEISNGDEEMYCDLDSNSNQFELESTKSLLKGSFLCRNSGGEGPSSAGKRRISWQDPVAVRV